MRVTAVVVTKGDRDISSVTDTLKQFDELIIWDNTKTPIDLKIYGRYAGAFCARNEFVYIQDDDCIVDSSELTGQFQRECQSTGKILCNFPSDRRRDYQGTGISLLGWGTIFSKRFLSSFDKYLSVFPQDELFLRECDRVFSFLNRRSIVYSSCEVLTHLSSAYGFDRMGKEPRHQADLREILQRLQKLEPFLRSIA